LLKNSIVSTETTNLDFASVEVIADSEAVVDHIVSGKPLDPEVVRRVRERAAKITEEIRRTHGVLDIGVAAIRELRDGA
jgi:hypothetical protein